jgi:hypothetical protein
MFNTNPKRRDIGDVASDAGKGVANLGQCCNGGEFAPKSGK